MTLESGEATVDVVGSFESGGDLTVSGAQDVQLLGSNVTATGGSVS
ncbi:MAG: hypothetical protein U5O39_19080 [Gammaproteobacteria bacterium]|nr:hypothetical protein [Gammaproteobacteria bacterium]